jgi:hypothetical protein
MKNPIPLVIKIKRLQLVSLRQHLHYFLQSNFVQPSLCRLLIMTSPTRLRIKSWNFQVFNSVSSCALKLITIASTLILSSCNTTQPVQPLIVQVDGPLESGDRFRSQERQRDVWIAPQATEDALLHEQVVTFIEKPQGWQLPTTIEPHTVLNPALPLESADYDAEILRRQRQIIKDKDDQIIQTNTEFESFKKETQATVHTRDQQIVDFKKRVEEMQKTLNENLQKLAEEEAAEERRLQEKKQKSWWKLWQ